MNTNMETSLKNQDKKLNPEKLEAACGGRRHWTQEIQLTEEEKRQIEEFNKRVANS